MAFRPQKHQKRRKWQKTPFSGFCGLKAINRNHKEDFLYKDIFQLFSDNFVAHHFLCDYKGLRNLRSKNIKLTRAPMGK